MYSRDSTANIREIIRDVHRDAQNFSSTGQVIGSRDTIITSGGSNLVGGNTIYTSGGGSSGSAIYTSGGATSGNNVYTSGGGYTSGGTSSRDFRTHFDGRDEIVTINGYTGALVNKSEIDNWRGPISLSEYPINVDPNPIITRRKVDGHVTNHQDITIRYLEPPTPPPPGEIIIQQEKPFIPPAAPPLIIRQAAPAAIQQEALVIREAPPPMPVSIGRKIVKILAPKIPPPPRKLIVERPPPAVAKAQSIIIERWLAPKQQARRVVFDGVAHSQFTGHAPVRNEIIEYDAPTVHVEKVFKDLGVTRMNPDEYWAKYGNSLIEYHNLPAWVREIRAPAGLLLASDYKATRPVLEGDIQWLSKINLEQEGLSEYASYVSSHSHSSHTGGTTYYDGGRTTTETYYDRDRSSPPRGNIVRTIVDGAYNINSGYPGTSYRKSVTRTVKESSNL